MSVGVILRLQRNKGMSFTPGLNHCPLWDRYYLCCAAVWVACFMLIALSISADVTAALPTRVHSLYLENEGRDDVTRAVVRDGEGYLWIATDNGLKRYDGYRFKVYGAGPDSMLSEENNAINDVLVSDNGLWLVGAQLNYFCLEDESFSRYEVSFGPSLNTLVEDPQGRLWLGGEGTGLLGFDPVAGKVFRRVFEKQAMGHIRRLHMSQAPGKLWVASSGGLYLYDIEKNSYEMLDLPLHYGVGVDAIRDIAEDQEGWLWVASDSGAFRVDPVTGEYTQYRADSSEPGALSTDRLWSVYSDSRGTVWLGTDKKGVHKYLRESDAFHHIPASIGDPDLFPIASISRIYEDQLGNLWFATGQFGVFRISERLNKFYVLRSSRDSRSSLAFNNVLDLHEDDQGAIWIATDGRGVNRFDPTTGQFSHFRHSPDDPDSLSSDSAIALAQGDDQRIWVGTWEGGISVIDTHNNQVRRIVRQPELPAEETLANDNVFRLEFAPNNKLFIAVHMIGLQILDTASGRYEVFSGHPGTPLDRMQNNTLNDFWVLDSGDAWLGGYQALEYYDASAGQVVNANLDVHEGIMDLYLDDEGILWIATRLRLIRFNPSSGSSKSYTPQHGLADEYVVSIEQDNDGFLWLGTRNGLNRFDPKEEVFWKYEAADGLAGNQFNRFSHLKTRSGIMYFGGTDGITVFDPHHLPRNRNPPVTRITRIELNRQLTSDQLREAMPSPVNPASELVLPYDYRDVGFEFASLSFLAPKKNRYIYRLAGLEEEWHEVGADRRYAHYTNLEPGEYTFEVYGSNNDGVWTEAPARVRVTVQHAWWQTWWAWVVYAAGMVAVLYFYGFWRSYKNRRRERQLKALVEEQTMRLKTANYEISQLNMELEQRVAERTKELSVEIEDRKRSEQKAHYIAFHDSLTKLFNRTWLLRHINDLIEAQELSSDHCFTVIAIGLDRFRRINEVYGHRTGDMILMGTAERLQALADSPGENAVRSGSDEFVYTVDRTYTLDDARQRVEEIMQVFAEPVVIGNISLTVSASVGVVVCDSSCTDANQVMRCANVAMQKAKESGRGRYQVFDDLMLSKITEEAELDEDLQEALAKNQLSAVYQPVVHTRTKKVSCFEILARWNHPEKGFIPPSEFIRMAESNGLIFDIGFWVLAEACRQLNTWSQLPGRTVLPVIAVNLSPIQLEQPDFLAKVKKILKEHSVSPSNIRFEITETALMRHSEEVDQCLFALRALGVQFAIDDFGTGYSSLSYLDRLPVQILKMDRCFISAIDSDEPSALSAREIVRASISLAHSLDMVVVGEGVETADQLRLLTEYGCEFAQGYFIARPLKPDDATEFLLASPEGRG